MKILIIKLSSIGDVVHTLPALGVLRRAFPEAKIDWLVEEAASTLLKDHPMVDELIVVRRRSWLKDIFRGFGGNWRIAQRLKASHYDMVIDFQGLFKSAIWVYLSKGKRRIGFAGGREMSSLPLNDKLPPYDKEMHAVDRYLKLARYAAGVEVEADAEGVEEDFPVHIAKEDEERVGRLLAESGIAEGDAFFVVSTHARWVTKLWSEANFAELIGKISRRYKIRPVIIGSKDEVDKARRIAEEAAGDVVDLAGRTNLRELMALLKRADFLITLDSGPMHMAAAVGTLVFAIFGPTAPWRTGPYGKDNVVLRREELECSPCFSRECRDIKCMELITPEEVLKHVEELMKSRGMKESCG
ncbi:MAG: lipopolysaccharide heptosyltransferase I [Deltaproteobacteria bacterium]|nr:lipopolysaccharide heptosyltransferase I [Deltaproteobacteria bacterium]